MASEVDDQDGGPPRLSVPRSTRRVKSWTRRIDDAFRGEKRSCFMWQDDPDAAPSHSSCLYATTRTIWSETSRLIVVSPFMFVVSGIALLGKSDSRHRARNYSFCEAGAPHSTSIYRLLVEGAASKAPVLR